MRTPTKPTMIADQRRQPTASPRNRAAPAVTVSGVAWKMIVAFAIGIWKSAER